MFIAALLALTVVAQTIPLEPAPRKTAPRKTASTKPAKVARPKAKAKAAAKPSPSATVAAPPKAPELPGVDAGHAGIAAGPGLFVPGLASFMKGDAAGGTLHLVWGLQGLGFALPALIDRATHEKWDSDRSYVAIVSGAGLFLVNYLASIVRAGRPASDTGATLDPLRVRLGITTVAGPRRDSIYYDDDMVPTIGQRLRIGVMIAPGLELALSGDAMFGDFDGGEAGLSVGGDLTGYIPTGTRVRPYIGMGVGYHPETPLVFGRAGLMIALSSSVDLQVGVQDAIATNYDVHNAYVQADIGFVQSF